MKGLNELSRKDSKELIAEIKLFIEYGVSADEKASAVSVLEGYRQNTLALYILRDFYSKLPGLREEAVLRVNKIVSRMGFFLVTADTATHEYLYFFNGEKPVYIGEKKDGIGESEVLSFFGFSSNEEFLKHQVQEGADNDEQAVVEKIFCPACAVAAGEFHHLGCPVEICPWCDGQLNYCNCRFEKLGVDEIEDESDLDRLEILLNDKGRVRFSDHHAPAYPTGGEG